MLSKALPMLLQMNPIWNLVKTGEVRINPDSSAPLDFRLELFEEGDSGISPKQFRFRVFRYDLFRIQPLSGATLRENAVAFADHLFLVADPMFDLNIVIANDPSEAWNLMLEIMLKQFRADEGFGSTP
jgi:hypothetical protein